MRELGLGSFVGSAAGAVHKDLVAVVDHSVEQGLGDDGVREQQIPVLWGSAGGQDP
jgi:hypothetical protein